MAELIETHEPSEREFTVRITESEAAVLLGLYEYLVLDEHEIQFYSGSPMRMKATSPTSYWVDERLTSLAQAFKNSSIEAPTLNKMLDVTIKE